MASPRRGGLRVACAVVGALYTHLAGCVEDVTLARVPVLIDAGALDVPTDHRDDAPDRAPPVDVVDVYTMTDVVDVVDALDRTPPTDVVDVVDVPDVPISTGWTLRATCTGAGSDNAPVTSALWQCTASLDDARGPIAGSALYLTADATVVDATVTAPGSFTAMGSGWPTRWTFRVAVSGGARWSETFDAPAYHQFTEPMHLSRIPQRMPLTVRWSPSGADGAMFTEPPPARPVSDTGVAVLPGELFVEVAEMNVPIRLRRDHVATPSGLAAGSFVRFEVSNGLSVHPD